MKGVKGWVCWYQLKFFQNGDVNVIMRMEISILYSRFQRVKGIVNVNMQIYDDKSGLKKRIIYKDKVKYLIVKFIYLEFIFY